MKKMITSRVTFLSCVMVIAFTLLSLTSFPEMAVADGGGWEPPTVDTIPNGGDTIAPDTKPADYNTMLGDLLILSLRLL